MARTELTRVVAKQAGADLTFTPGTADGLQVTNHRTTGLVVRNVDLAETRSFTFPAQNGTSLGSNFQDRIVSITSGSFKVIGNIETTAFNTADNKVLIDLNDAGSESDLEFAAFDTNYNANV